jgi:hypothetical protein
MIKYIIVLLTIILQNELYGSPDYLPITELKDFKINNISKEQMLNKIENNHFICTIRETNFNFTICYEVANKGKVDTVYFIKRLEGFAHEEKLEVNKYVTTYSNLVPGRYLFKVRSSFNKELWSNDLIIEINVKNPFIASIYFKIIFIVIFICIVWLLVKVVKKIFFKRKRL